MSELITLLKVTLGLAFKALIRAPYTHSKAKFSVLRCLVIYLRLIFLVLFFNPDLKPDSTLYKTLNPVSPFLFPYYKILTTSFSESSQTSFWVLIGINLFHIIILFIGKILYFGAIKLKISLYLMELIMPDMILFLVYNFMNLSTFEFYSQSLGFLVTLSLCITVCIGGPIIIMYDIEVYKTAMMMFTGLKTVKKEWHYVIKIQEVGILLCHYFCALWIKSQDYSRSVILGVLMFVFMRLQRTYWPFLYRNDNLFMDKAYLALIFVCAVEFDSYWNLMLFVPLVGYFENRSPKQE